jgi:hypothetical protein
MSDRKYKAWLVERARSKEMTDVEILKDLVEGTGGDERRQIISDWAEALGMSVSGALRVSRDAGLIPSSHPPRTRPGTPPRKD